MAGFCGGWVGVMGWRHGALVTDASAGSRAPRRDVNAVVIKAIRLLSKSSLHTIILRVSNISAIHYLMLILVYDMFTGSLVLGSFVLRSPKGHFVCPPHFHRWLPARRRPFMPPATLSDMPSRSSIRRHTDGTTLHIRSVMSSTQPRRMFKRLRRQAVRWPPISSRLDFSCLRPRHSRRATRCPLRTLLFSRVVTLRRVI